MGRWGVSVRLMRVAERDGVEHVLAPAGSRTLCGRMGVSPRYGWPRKTKCEPCRVAAEALEAVR